MNREPTVEEQTMLAEAEATAAPNTSIESLVNKETNIIEFVNSLKDETEQDVAERAHQQKQGQGPYKYYEKAFKSQKEQDQYVVNPNPDTGVEEEDTVRDYFNK